MSTSGMHRRPFESRHLVYFTYAFPPLVSHFLLSDDGYRLTIKGYDYLALNTLTQRNILVGVGSKIGVGKESDIFKVLGADDRLLCMKLHRFV